MVSLQTNLAPESSIYYVYVLEKNIEFSENFAYVLNGWSLTIPCIYCWLKPIFSYLHGKIKTIFCQINSLGNTSGQK